MPCQVLGNSKGVRSKAPKGTHVKKQATERTAWFKADAGMKAGNGQRHMERLEVFVTPIDARLCAIKGTFMNLFDLTLTTIMRNRWGRCGPGKETSQSGSHMAHPKEGLPRSSNCKPEPYRGKRG